MFIKKTNFLLIYVLKLLWFSVKEIFECFIFTTMVKKYFLSKLINLVEEYLFKSRRINCERKVASKECYI